MTVPELFIRRPVMTTLVMLGILLFGIIGYRYLPVSDLPSVDYPTIQVQASLPGASPETMASAVATPLERQFTTIAGVDSMSSVSALGLTQITIQFTLDRSIDAAGQDVQAAMAKAAKQLPPNMPTPPTYNKVNPADQPILFMALTSDTLPLSTVDDYGETLLAQRISMVNGVAQVGIFGAQTYAVHVQLDPNALANRGIGIDEVHDALAKGNVNLPTGTLYGKNQAFIVQANGQLMKAADYRPLIVVYRQGRPVRLEEIGRVIDSVQNDKIASWFNNKRGIVLSVQRQPGVKDHADQLAPAVSGVGEPVQEPGAGQLEPLRPQAPADQPDRVHQVVPVDQVGHLDRRSRRCRHGPGAGQGRQGRHIATNPDWRPCPERVAILPISAARSGDLTVLMSSYGAAPGVGTPSQLRRRSARRRRATRRGPGDAGRRTRGEQPSRGSARPPRGTATATGRRAAP